MRLVDHEDVAILVKDQVAQEGRVLVGLASPARPAARPARCSARQGRHAHGLAGRDAVVRLGATAIDPDLPRSQELLQMPEGDVRDNAP